MLSRFVATTQIQNPYLFITNEIKKHNKVLPATAINEISNLITNYKNLSDHNFISSLVEISNFPEFRPVFINLNSKLNNQIPLLQMKEIIKISQSLSKLKLLQGESSEIISRAITSRVNELDLNDVGITLYAFSSSPEKSPLMIKKLSEHSLKLIQTADKPSLIKIFKSFSYYPESGFCQKALTNVETIKQSLTLLEILDFVEKLWKCDEQAGELEHELFANLKSLDNETYAHLINRVARYKFVKNMYRDKLSKNLSKRVPKEFSSLAILHTVNGLHELGHGKLACEFFEKYLEKNIDKIETQHLYLLMYVFGIKEMGSRALWRKLADLIKENLESMTHIEKIWSVYGLFKAARLKDELYRKFVSLFDNTLWCAKSLEKVFEIADGLNDSKTVKNLIPFFIDHYKEFYPNKGLICIDVIETAELMTPKLYDILQYYKSKQPTAPSRHK